MKLQRNDPCHCGSGKKYKKCCLSKDQEKEREELEFVEDEIKPTLADIPDKFVDKKYEHYLPESEETTIFDEFWIEFEDRNFDKKVSMIENALNDPQLLDADFMTEVLISLNDSTKNFEERKKYQSLVIKYQKENTKLFKDGGAYLLGNCVENALFDEQCEDLKILFEEYSQFAAATIDSYNRVVDQLAYHGYLELLRNGLRIGWKKVENSSKIMSWGIDEFSYLASNYEMFYYLSATDQPFARDKKLLKILDKYIDMDIDVFERYFSILVDLKSPEWKIDDFKIENKKLPSQVVGENLLIENITILCDYFFNYLTRGAQFSVTKAHLMRSQLGIYLSQKLAREIGPKRRKFRNQIDILCPDKRSLDEFLAHSFHMLNFMPYRALVCFECVPYWLDYLEMSGLIDDRTKGENKQSISELYPIIEKLLLKEYPSDKFALVSLKNAWNR
jgi:hypothetical protein